MFAIRHCRRARVTHRLQRTGSAQYGWRVHLCVVGGAKQKHVSIRKPFSRGYTCFTAAHDGKHRDDTWRPSYVPCPLDSVLLLLGEKLWLVRRELLARLTTALSVRM